MRVGWVVAVALLMSAPVAAQSVKAGIDAYARGDYAGALTVWRPLAEKGDADAMFNLGQAYRLGKGVSIDLGEALAWYNRAATAGHVDAQTQLGILYFQNGNQLSGLRWLKQAADAGEPRAQLLYGTALFNGDGLIRRDPELAYRYVSKSAAQGLAPANSTLAEMAAAMPADMRKRVGASVAQATAATPAAKVASLPKAVPATKPVTKAPTPPRLASTAAASPRPFVGSLSMSPPTTGGWRVQLGAFGQRSAADALFRKLAAGPLAGKQAYAIPVGAMTRLQAGPYPSRAAASAACATLSARGQPCFAVAAR